jgi:hypothetical protein
MFEPLRQMEVEKETAELSPTGAEVWRAGIEQENEVYNLVRALSTPKPKPQEDFDLFKRAEEAQVNPREFITAMSDEEFDQRLLQRQRERKNQEILDAAGWAGLGARVGAAVLSPTSLIPFARGLTGARSILNGAASVVAGAAIQEGILYGTQETRTKEEVMFSLAASTVIGGVLGAIAHTMSKSVVDKIAHDMVNSTKELTILPPPKNSSLSAAENAGIEDVGPMVKGWGADKLAFLSPITRGFQQWNAPAFIADEGGSAMLRKMTAGFSQAGLSLAENAKFRAAIAGGNVEDIKRTYAAVSYGARVDIDKFYIEHILGEGAKGFGKKTRALVQGYRADGKLNYDEFKRQITLDIWSNFTREGTDPFVRKAAKAIDEKVYKKMYDEGVNAGLFTGEEKTVGDENYANRVYNNEVIMRRHEEFVSILAKNYSKKMSEQFSKQYEKLRERMGKDAKTLEDMQRPLDEVLALREQIKAEAAQLEMQTSLEVLEGVDAIKGIRGEVKKLTTELDELKKQRIDGADIAGFNRRKDRMDELEAQIKSKALQAENTQKALGEGLEKYTKGLAEVRRRLAGLSRAHALQDVRLQRKLEKIEANEDAQAATIIRAQKQLMKFVKMLDSVSDDKLDEFMSKWRTEFAQNTKKLEKLEEKRFELEKTSELPTDPGSDDTPPAPPTPKGPDVPPGPTPEEKLAQENKLKEQAEKELFVKPLPELQGLSRRDIADYSDNAILADEVIKAPTLSVHKSIMEFAKKGYFFDGKFVRQAVQDDVTAAQINYSAVAEVAAEMEQKLIKDFAGKGPDFKMPFGQKKVEMTFDEAMAVVDNEVSMASQKLARMERLFDKAKKHPKTQAPVPPPVAPTPPPPPVKVKPFVENDPRLTPNFGEAIKTWTNANEALEWFVRHGTDDYRAIAKRLKGKIDNSSFYLVDPNGTDPNFTYARGVLSRNKWAGFYNQWDYGNGAPRAAGLFVSTKYMNDESLVLHELLHAALYGRINFGNKIENKGTKLGKLVKELDELRTAVMAQIAKDGNLPFVTKHHVKYAVSNIHELQTQALTLPEVRDYFRNIKVKGKNVYNEFVRLMREILGIPPEEESAFVKLLDITDKMLKEKNPFDTVPSKPMGVQTVAEPNDELVGAIAEAEANFKQWFGESKVVDAEGKPLVVYHGTSKDADFTKFKVGKRGAFFTTDAGGASEYALTNDSQKLVLKPGTWEFEQKNSASRVMPVYLSVQRPYKLTPEELDAYATDPRGYQKAQAEIADRAKAQGYDGIDYGGGVWVVFEPTQIKSAISNSGAYSQKQAHISGAKKFGDDPAMELEDRMEKIIAKMDDLAERMENLDSFDRTAFRAEVEQMMTDLADTHAKINAKRAVRNEKLWKQVENYSPEARAKRMEEFKLKAADRPKEFTSKYNTLAKGDIMSGVANFDEYADEKAREVVKKILGVDRRLAYSDIIAQERGPELARLLNIPSEEIADFLETDIEHLVAVYTRTVGSDLAIAKVFGTADAAEWFQKLDTERNDMLKKIKSMEGKDGKPLSPEEQEKLEAQTNKFYESGRRDLLVLLERAKGMRGLPKDPDAWSSRAAKTVMDINYLRFMGGVVINSVADLARPVMRHGLTRTFKDGILPMIRAFRTIRMSQREAKLAGTATDVVMHTRAMAILDMFDDTYRGTSVEKGIHYLSTRMGTIALFDQWTSAMKEFTAGIVNARILDNIAIVNGEKASAKEIRKAQEFLARNNIDEEIAQTIWREVTNGKGGGKVDGIWLPNTEDWNVADPNVARARQAYRAALAQEVDSTIITPGFERPNWVDMNVPARMLAQFKSFGFSSTQKTLMAGLQEHDAAFLNGVVLSLGLGVVSYYLWAMAAGGDPKEKMLKAMGDLDGEGWKVIADEAITRSGVLGVFADVQKFAHRVPVMREYASFSGADSTRRAGGDLTESLLGPSFDLLERATTLVAGIDDPTKGTLHAARLMMPLQNIFYLRYLLDQVENSIDLPERREPK